MFYDRMISGPKENLKKKKKEKIKEKNHYG